MLYKKAVKLSYCGLQDIMVEAEDCPGGKKYHTILSAVIQYFFLF